MRIQIIGPFVSEYSLARVNRAIAEKLRQDNKNIKLSLFSPKYLSGSAVTKSDIKKYPILETLVDDIDQEADVHLYSAFPKSTADNLGLEMLCGKINAALIAWEESVFPEKWVQEINMHLDAVFAISSHVARILERCGVRVPISILSLGVSKVEADNNYKLDLQTSFNFLHISSGHMRKGLDLLLQAFVEEFSQSDEAGLIIKALPNPNFNAKNFIKSAKGVEGRVVLIEDSNLSDAQIASLYEYSDCVVLPARVEGFNLPAAEAMLYERPLITTAYSGHLDFCNETNSRLLPYTIVPATGSHLALPGSKWAEPDISALKTEMRNIYKNREVFNRMVAKARSDISNFTWDNTASRLLEQLRLYLAIKNAGSIKLDLVSPFYSQGGVSEYSADLYRSLPKNIEVEIHADKTSSPTNTSEPVKRDWSSGRDKQQELMSALTGRDIVHIQYHTDFFPVSILRDLIAVPSKCILTLHILTAEMTNTETIEAFKKCSKIFVHNQRDFNTLESKGLKNIQLFKHGIIDFPDHLRSMLRSRIGISATKVVATHGLLHDRKGVLELIEALALIKSQIPDILLLCLTAVSSQSLSSQSIYKKCLNLIRERNLEDNVIIIPDYLAREEVVVGLQMADLIVLPYAELPEGSSGAIRTCAAAKRPILCTESTIFTDFPAAKRIPDNNPKTIADKVVAMLNDEGSLHSAESKVRQFVASNQWRKLSLHYFQDLAQISAS